MTPYKVFVRMEAAEVMRSIHGAQRRLITSFVDELASRPNQEGDYQEKDQEDRMIEIKVIGKFAITYWTDHAVKEIKVVDFRRADRV